MRTLACILVGYYLILAGCASSQAPRNPQNPPESAELGQISQQIDALEQEQKATVGLTVAAEGYLKTKGLMEKQDYEARKQALIQLQLEHKGRNLPTAQLLDTGADLQAHLVMLRKNESFLSDRVHELKKQRSSLVHQETLGTSVAEVQTSTARVAQAKTEPVAQPVQTLPAQEQTEPVPVPQPVQPAAPVQEPTPPVSQEPASPAVVVTNRPENSEVPVATPSPEPIRQEEVNEPASQPGQAAEPSVAPSPVVEPQVPVSQPATVQPQPKQPEIETAQPPVRKVEEPVSEPPKVVNEPVREPPKVVSITRPQITSKPVQIPDVAEAEETTTAEPPATSAAEATEPEETSSFSQGNYRALIIANYRYPARFDQWPSLRTPKANADAVVKALKGLFGIPRNNIYYVENATRKKMADAFSRLATSVRGKESVLICYFGHGHYENDSNEGFWTSVDIRNDSNQHLIPSQEIQQWINRISQRAQHVLVVSNSCFSRPLIRKLPAGSRPQVKTLKSCRILAGNEEDYNDRSYKNSGMSPFGYFLVEGLKQRTARSSSKLASYVRKNLRKLGQSADYGVLKSSEDRGGELVFSRTSEEPIEESGSDEE